MGLLLEEAVEPGLAQEALAGLVMFVGALALAPIAMLLAHRIFPGRNVFFARWGFSHVAAAALAGAAGLVLVGGVLRRFVPEQEGTPPATSPGAGEALSEGPRLSTLELGGEPVPIAILELAATVAVGLLVALVIAFFVRRLSPEGLRALGFHRGRAGRAVAVGVVSYVLLLPAVYGLALAWPWVLEALGQPTGPQAIAADLATLTGTWLVVAVVAGVLVAPFLEELVFRGFLQPLLVQNFGDRGGVVLASAVFAVLHGQIVLVPIFGLSLVLGAVMLRTQRLLAAWSVHALHNALMMFLVLSPWTSEQVLGQLGGLH